MAMLTVAIRGWDAFFILSEWMCISDSLLLIRSVCCISFLCYGKKYGDISSVHWGNEGHRGSMAQRSPPRVLLRSHQEFSSATWVTALCRMHFRKWAFSTTSFPILTVPRNTICIYITLVVMFKRKLLRQFLYYSEWWNKINLFLS